MEFFLFWCFLFLVSINFSVLSHTPVVSSGGTAAYISFRRIFPALMFAALPFSCIQPQIGPGRIRPICYITVVETNPPIDSNNNHNQVKGGSLEVLRAFRHFRPAAAGRRLFMDYTEFRESIKQKARYAVLCTGVVHNSRTYATQNSKVVKGSHCAYCNV